jgi:hypothetical protein
LRRQHLLRTLPPKAQAEAAIDSVGLKADAMSFCFRFLRGLC